MGRMQILYGGLLFEGGPGEATYTIERDGVSGLLAGGAGFRRQKFERPNAHGDFAGAVFRTGRLMSWRGEVLTSTPGEQEHAIRALEAIASTGQLQTAVFRGADDVVWSMLGVDREIDIEITMYGEAARYAIQGYAPDPRLYGETNMFLDGEPMYHYGNFPAIPILSVTATATMTGGYTVFGPDNKRFVVTQTLPAGSTHQIDMSNGWLTLNGTQQIGAVGYADLWTIPPGKTITHGFVPASGSGVLTGTAPDTYI